MGLRFACAAAVVASCGQTAPPPVDASPDAGPDAATSCPAERVFTGEVIDWDSTDTAFKGVNQAELRLTGGSDATNPNGRFELCLSTATAEHATLVPPPGYMGGTAVADPAFLRAQGYLSIRLPTHARLAAYLTAAGLPAQAPDKALVMVFVPPNTRDLAISLNRANLAPRSFTGASWTADANAKGPWVLFSNVPVDDGVAMVTASGEAIGAGGVPLRANELTFLGVAAQ